MMGDLGRLLIVVGLLLAGFGVILRVAGRIPWLGRLPGDISYKGEHFTVYFPLATCVLISLALSLLFYFFRR